MSNGVYGSQSKTYGDAITACLNVPDAHVSSVRTADLNTDNATADTVRQMYSIVEQTYNSGEVQCAVRDALVTSPSPITCTEDAARCIWYYVKRHVKFRNDIEVEGMDNEKELLISPPVLLSMVTPMGDCDDFTMLVLAMCRACSIPAWAVTVAASPMMPGGFSHIYAACRVIDKQGEIKRVAMDCSHGSYFGWECPEYKITRICEW